MDFNDNFSLKGILTIRVHKNGILIAEHVENNLIVNGARDQVVRLIAGNTVGRNIAQIAFGTNGTTPEVTDSVITQQYARPINGFSYPAMGQVQFDWELPVTENNGMAIMEFGLLTDDGMLFARRTRRYPIHKESDISIEGHWTILL